MQFYIAEGTQQTGPFDLDTIRTGLNTGKYQPTQLAWYEGAPGWEPISKLPGLEAATPPPPPPVPYSPAPAPYSPAPPFNAPAYPSAPPSQTPAPYSPAPPPNAPGSYSPAPPYYPSNPGSYPSAPPNYNAPYGPGAGAAPAKKGPLRVIGGILLALLSITFGVFRILHHRSWSDSSYNSYSSSSYSTPAPTPTPRQDLVPYQNIRTNFTTGDRATHFVAFNINYPKYWGYKWGGSTQDKNNYIEMEHKRTINNSFETTEQVNIGCYHAPPNSTAAASLATIGPLACTQLEAGFKKTFPNLTHHWQVPSTVNGYSAYDYLAHCTQKDKSGQEVTLWMRIIMIAPPTGPDGVIITLLTSSYEPDVTTAADVGVTADSGLILKSFRF